MKIIEILIFSVKNASKLKAKANVTLDLGEGIEIQAKGFRIHDDGEKAAWIGVPSERYVSNGKPGYSELLRVNSVAQSKLYPEILAAYSREKSKFTQL